MANTLSNAMTEVGVKMLLLSLKEWVKSHQNDQIYHNNDYIDKCRHAAVKLACAVTHSSTTKLHYIRLCDEYNIFTHDFLKEYLGTVLEKTTNLKELVSLNHPGVTLTSDLKNVMHWSGYISPENLHDLAIANCELMILNLNNPSVSDRSVHSILKFVKLIQLDIINTKLTANGVESLIRGLKVCNSTENASIFRRNHLTHLALKVCPRILNVIPECLPNLTTLKLMLGEEMDLTVLKELKHLTYLSLKSSLGVDFACARSLIEQMGWQLKKLILDMSNVNLKFISKHCFKLQEFGIHVYLFDEEGNSHSLEHYKQHFPKEFKSVEKLNLIMFGYEFWDVLPCFLTCFTNVKIIKLFCDSEPESRNVSIGECLLRPFKEGRLEEIFLNSYKLQLRGRHTVIYDNHGLYTVVMENELDDVIRELIYPRGIFKLRRRVRFVLT
ncbi:hypothetical protein L9F63_016108 [Diploptera punctata]|uniref:Uncharacterized protein n=1 Tax=Diploptera punctata TaxID=6984 RepID=A0AAD8EI82_DIPPU|nr:hypothetical protein L9F63_016108 [Diploptera punctata]